MNNIEEICKIASSWWTNVIKNPKMDNGDESQAGMLINMLATLNTSKITPEQQKQFNYELYEEIKNTIKDYDDTQIMWLDVDYGPNKYLSEPAEKCNISLNNFPIKTTMQINKHVVKVRYGYGSDYETLYADKYYYENEIKSYEETIEYYKEQDESYFFIGSKEAAIKRCNNMINKYKKCLEEIIKKEANINE
jgi:hypothetical protein